MFVCDGASTLPAQGGQAVAGMDTRDDGKRISASSKARTLLRPMVLNPAGARLLRERLAAAGRVQVSLQDGRVSGAVTRLQAVSARMEVTAVRSDKPAVVLAQAEVRDTLDVSLEAHLPLQAELPAELVHESLLDGESYYLSPAALSTWLKAHLPTDLVHEVLGYFRSVFDPEKPFPGGRYGLQFRYDPVAKVSLCVISCLDRRLAFRSTASSDGKGMAPRGAVSTSLHQHLSDVRQRIQDAATPARGARTRFGEFLGAGPGESATKRSTELPMEDQTTHEWTGLAPGMLLDQEGIAYPLSDAAFKRLLPRPAADAPGKASAPTPKPERPGCLMQ